MSGRASETLIIVRDRCRQIFHDRPGLRAAALAAVIIVLVMIFALFPSDRTVASPVPPSPAAKSAGADASPAPSEIKKPSPLIPKKRRR